MRLIRFLMFLNCYTSLTTVSFLRFLRGMKTNQLPRPAGVEHVDKSLKTLGLVAAGLASVTSHDIRRGAFRDLANLKACTNDILVGITNLLLTWL